MENIEKLIEEVILSTLVVQNKESIGKFCVPKIMAIINKIEQEALHEFPPVYGNPNEKGVTIKELSFLDGITSNIDPNDPK